MQPKIIERIPTENREKLLFDGENYYLLRSLNDTDVKKLKKREGISPRKYSKEHLSIKDIIEHSRANTNSTYRFISMTSDPNVVLTYDRSNSHRFALIKINPKELETSKNLFKSGDYLLEEMEHQVEAHLQNAPESVKKQIQAVENANSIQEIKEIINGADKKVNIGLIDSEQRYLSKEEQLIHAKSIAKCKLLNYYGLMSSIEESLGKTGIIEYYTGVMRVAYHNEEWLSTEPIEQERVISIPKILVDSLALLKQAEFQGKDKEIISRVEQEVLKIAVSGEKINQTYYQLEYSVHNNMRNDLTIDRAYEITNGQISYRDTNMQQIAIRSLAEMTLNKRTIIELLQERLPDINIEGLLSNTYCINQEMITRQNNRGSQIGININFLISDYGYDFDEETSKQIIQSVENLNNDQLINIIMQGINAQEISSLLIRTRENSDRIESTKTKVKSAKYIAEAVVEGYNWKKDGNSLTKKEKTMVANALLRNITDGNELYQFYGAINRIQIGKDKFTQDEIFAIMINIAIDKKIGDISYGDLLKKDLNEIQLILLDNQGSLQKSVSPISIDLLARRGREINRLKSELIELGIDAEFLELKDIRNVYEVKKIVEEYDFGREISRKEKASLIKAVLGNRKLNKNKRAYLTTLIQNMEQIGLRTEEIYGMIINLGVNGNVLEETGYNYTFLLANYNNVCQIIAQYKDKIRTKVTEITIDAALSENLNETEQEQIKDELIELGIDADFLKLKDIKNVYEAKKIIEGYDFGREISGKEKASLIKAVLGNRKLNKNKSAYLITLMQNMEQIGLNTQEIYGMIINLGVNGNVLEETGYSYAILLDNKNNAYQTIAQYKDKIRTKVTEITIDAALSENLNETDQKEIKDELIELGIDAEFLELKDIRNVYEAKKIVEGYDFGREISGKEKVALIKNILNSSLLNKERTSYLITLMQNMEQIGLNTQEIYGMIINLGAKGKVIEEKGYAYQSLLSNKNNACQTIAQYKDEIQTEVTEETIQRALKKANKPRKVKGQDIAKATMELTIEGNGGSKICDDVQADYIRLLDEKTNYNEKKGSEQGDSN